jgi:hypothetical protein
VALAPVANLLAMGGLKLALEAAARDDRRIRFATLRVTPAGCDQGAWIVTDARGRLRYRLAAGEYRLSIDQAGETCFTVRGGRWTTVRVRLP